MKQTTKPSFPEFLLGSLTKYANFAAFSHFSCYILQPILGCWPPPLLQLSLAVSNHPDFWEIQRFKILIVSKTQRIRSTHLVDSKGVYDSLLIHNKGTDCF